MDRITLKIDSWVFIDNDLINYLFLLNGVILTTVDDVNNEINVEYDSSIIPLKLLKMEILLYLDLKFPSIILFDKHASNDDIKKDTITINDLCCEYCLNAMIEELLEIDGIESAYTDFNYINKYDVNIFITYNAKLIDSAKINEIKERFNHYY